jgi:hypothetical protein
VDSGERFAELKHVNAQAGQEVARHMHPAHFLALMRLQIGGSVRLVDQERIQSSAAGRSLVARRARQTRESAAD